MKRCRTVIAAAVLAASWACSEPPVEGPPPDLGRFQAGQLQSPGASWAAVERAHRWGWSEERLAEAEAYFETLDASSVMIVHRGVLIAGWGDLADRQPSQSIRKAFLGALLGQEVEAGRLSLESTLAELGIDDSSNPLTAEEKKARVLDLLQSTSGIYLPAIYEARSWKRVRPASRPSPTAAWSLTALRCSGRATSWTPICRRRTSP